MARHALLAAVLSVLLVFGEAVRQEHEKTALGDDLQTGEGVQSCCRCEGGSGVLGYFKSTSTCGSMSKTWMTCSNTNAKLC
ncbi:unnamed protein product [Symbiodinium microadriaticum]|nr:unnamed protein product [Symbiodinium microadriaticum]CAE7946767.1 unnamed protein product [Symbiodinium sp. KB8]